MLTQVKSLTREEVKAGYRDILYKAKLHGQVKEAMAELGKRDRFFLMTNLLGREDADNDWVFRQSRMVQANPNGNLDLWFREGFKSSIITNAGTIQDIINDPENTFGILSYNRPIAKGFLRQIKREFENNDKLKELYSNVLWRDPDKEAPKWSEDEGLIVKRQGNPNEATIEAWGIDAQPTSKHFKIRIYNDIVTRETVKTPESIANTVKAWEESLNLGRTDGGLVRYEGTRWHYNDPYKTIMDRGAAIPRIFPATKNGKPDGEPWLWTREQLAQKIRDMGPYTSACQLFMDPKQDSTYSLDERWLQFWPAQHYRGQNIYLICDPAGSKKKDSDYTVFFVVGLGSDGNYYVITMVRDRLSLTEKANVLFKLHREYRPKMTGYEQYGLQADIEHFQDRMRRDNYRFPITPLKGPQSKQDRIMRLEPLWAAGRVWLPDTCIRGNYEGVLEDLTKTFINDEYKAFPFCVHDDMLDCMSRILDEDLQAAFPKDDISKTFDNITRREDDAAADYDPLYRGVY